MQTGGNCKERVMSRQPVAGSCRLQDRAVMHTRRYNIATKARMKQSLL